MANEVYRIDPSIAALNYAEDMTMEQYVESGTSTATSFYCMLRVIFENGVSSYQVLFVFIQNTGR